MTRNEARAKTLAYVRHYRQRAHVHATGGMEWALDSDVDTMFGFLTAVYALRFITDQEFTALWDYASSWRTRAKAIAKAEGRA